MICQECSDLFKFSNDAMVKRILQNKALAIEDAIQHGRDESIIQGLKNELQRYEEELQKCIGDERPCPWSPAASFTERYDKETYILINTLFSTRLWGKTKKSAKHCALCYQIIVMGNYSLGDDIPDRTELKCQLWTDDYSKPIEMDFRFVGRGTPLQRDGERIHFTLIEGCGEQMSKYGSVPRWP
jgi:hypothetical protein